MNPVPLKLVTIIAESLLEDRLVADLKALGARGYTVADVRGEGSQGVRANHLEGRNVRIEVLVAPDVANAVLAHVADKYFALYAVVAYLTDVRVVRGDKYR